MGIFEKLFPARPMVNEATLGYISTLTGYQPVFNSFRSGIYESELCRASIHAFATHCSKLKPVVAGARRDMQTVLEYQPNPWMDTTKFLYKTATILETENTCFIVPIYDEYWEKIVGIYPVQPSMAEVRETKSGKAVLCFTFRNGKQGKMYFDKVGILSKYLYKHEFFGENNDVLRPTLDLFFTQQQGIKEGIKQSATIRFLGKLGTALKEADIEAERKRWKRTNLSIDNNSGIALFDTKYSDVKQVDSKPYVIDAAQMAAVKQNVYEYFGINDAILTNKFTPDEWAAYYEAKVEPFALQLSLVLTNMFYSAEQKVRGNAIQFTANRLQYASTSEKLAVVSEGLDRGILSRNEAREIFNLDPIEGGDVFIVRGEYYNADGKLNEGENNGNE